MGKIVYTSRVKIVQDKPPLRHAYIEGFFEPFHYGVHSGIAEFYGITPTEHHPATLDHMVSAVAG